MFQPNTYDNNKLLFVWFAMTCGIVAEFLMTVYDRIAEKKNDKASADEPSAPLARRIAQRALLAVIIGVMLLSGVMTIAREYVSADHLGVKDGKLQTVESGYQAVSATLVRAAEYVNENAEPKATLLTATNHNNAMAMLTGRNIVCGADTFLYFHGVNYQERAHNVQLMYEQPEQYFDQLAQQYNVDYVLISTWELSKYNVDTNYFTRFTPVFSESGVTLYRIGG